MNDMDELNRCIPNSEYVKIPESTHETPADNPEAFNTFVLNFLAKHFPQSTGI